ncbi:MAG: phosphate acyltransferase PlsX [Patescibacteria group bacterium]|jgi:glycerol-3-phosphate acyltransferase PlsX
MIITVDAMGGDSFPDVPIDGALLALQELPQDFSINLIGDSGVIQEYLKGKTYSNLRLHICDASEVIAMDEKLESARRKRRSSIMLGLEQQTLGQSQAFISAGNTAAVMALAVVTLRPLPGIERPAIAVTMPTVEGPCVILDVGASVDCTPQQLADFGMMGSIYAQHILGIKTPRIALISIGEEPAKGNDATRKAHELLQAMTTHNEHRFIGNLEGSDILWGKADVMVTDGFTGNILLKLAESFLPALNAIVKKILRRGRLDQQGFALLAKGVFLGPTIGALKRTFDVEKYGGAPLLGIQGTVIIAHGKSTPKAILSAIAAARSAVHANINQLIADNVKRS